MAKLSDKEKMEMFENGTRRTNLKACSPAKLIWYYRICYYLKLENSAKAILEELKNRSEFNLIWAKTVTSAEFDETSFLEEINKK